MEQNFGMLVLNASSIARVTNNYALIIDGFDKQNPEKMKAARSDSFDGVPRFIVYPDASYEKYDAKKAYDYGERFEESCE